MDTRTVALLVAALLAPWGLMAAAAEPQPPVPRASELEDAVEPFVPSRPRNEAQSDRVRSLALFAAGRVAEQKQDYPLALRSYQRAWRLDPEAVPALREIVPLAFNLDRQAEAIRYALLLAERDPSDPVLLRRLAIYLTEEGDTDRALALYSKAIAAQEKDKSSAVNRVLLWMEMAKLCYVGKKYDQSAHYFAEVIKALDNPKEFGLDAVMQKALFGKPELTYQLMGESFLEAGRPADALSAFDKSQQAKGDEALAAFNRARVDAAQKQPAQALAKLQTYFDKHAAIQGTAAYQLLADLLGQLGQADQLVPRLEKLREADPRNVPLGYFLAQRYAEADQLDQAESIYSQLLEQHKARPPLEAYQALVDVQRRQKAPEKLLATLGDATGRMGSLDPLGPSVKALLADDELSKQLLAVAQRQLEAQAPAFNYGARLAAALGALERKDFATANTFFDAALKAEGAKPAEALVTWGLELFMANQYAEAAEVFERGLSDNVLPAENASLHFYLAGALEMSGRTDEAIVEARKAAELKSDSPRHHGRIGWIEYHAKRYDAARKSYQVTLDKFQKVQDPPEVREVLRDARLAMSNIAVIEGRLEEAEDWLEQVLDEFPEDVGALNDLGYLWADASKHLHRALPMIQTAVVREPKNMAYRDSLGWVLFRLGRFDEAVAELKAAAAVDEPDGVILDHMADAQLKAGDAAGAVENWRRAAETFDKNSEPKKAAAAREKMSRVSKPAPAKP